MKYWLMKSEPSAYSIDDLERQGIGTWDGVRNYAARNNMQAMTRGDLIFFYHSSAAVIGIAGIAEVAREAYPDPTQFDRSSHYYDPKASAERPIWSVVDIRFKKRFNAIVTLQVLKNDPMLKDMLVVQKGSRLSVQPVTKEHYTHILSTYAS